MSPPPPHMVATRELARALEPAGFDLVACAQVGWYNRAVPAGFALPELGDPGHLVLVVGNTRALWPIFVRAVHTRPELARAEDPLDRYTESALGAALAGLESVRAVAHELRFAHEKPPRRVAMQQLAHVAGLAYLSPSHLSVHPRFGPWLGLRAALLVAVPGPPDPQPVWRAPCACAEHCAPALERALALSNAPGHALESRDIRRDWHAWVALRDACPVGREHRYSDAQIEYHYTNDRRAIRL